MEIEAQVEIIQEFGNLKIPEILMIALLRQIKEMNSSLANIDLGLSELRR